MNFKLKSDTIFILRQRLEEIFFLESTQTEAYRLSRPTLFVLTKKFTNLQLKLYKELPINETKLYKISFEIHEAVLLKNILLNYIESIDNAYSYVLINDFIDELHKTTAV